VLEIKVNKALDKRFVRVHNIHIIRNKTMSHFSTDILADNANDRAAEMTRQEKIDYLTEDGAGRCLGLLLNNRLVYTKDLPEDELDFQTVESLYEEALEVPGPHG